MAIGTSEQITATSRGRRIYICIGICIVCIICIIHIMYMYHTLSEGLCNYKCFVLGVQGYSLDLVLHLSQDASRSLTPLLHCLARGSIVGSCLVTSFLPSPHWSTIFTLSPAILAPLFEFLLQSLQPLHSCPHSILIKYLTPRGPKRTLRIVVFVVLLVVFVVGGMA